MIRVLSVIFLSILLYSPITYAQNNVTGKVEILRMDEAGNFYFLKDKNNRLIFLCSIDEPSSDPSKKWIADAENLNQDVTLNGVLVEDENNNIYSFKDNNYKIVKIGNNSKNNSKKSSTTMIYHPIGNHKINCGMYGEFPITIDEFIQRYSKGVENNGSKVTVNYKKINDNMYRFDVIYLNMMTDQKGTITFGYTCNDSSCMLSNVIENGNVYNLNDIFQSSEMCMRITRNFVNN